MNNKVIYSIIFIVLLLSLAGCEFNNQNNPSSLESLDTSINSDTVSVASEDPRPALQWPIDNEIVSILPNFNGGKIVEITPSENSVLLTITNVEHSAFGLYVTALKEFSFTEVIFENDNLYSANKLNSEKNEGVTVRYYDETSTMTIDVSIK